MPKRDADASSDFRIFETEQFQGRLRKLPGHDSRFLRRKLADYVYLQLRANPFLGPNIRKLKGYQPDTWRYRLGRFRVFFIVDQQARIVSILALDDRRDAYR